MLTRAYTCSGALESNRLPRGWAGGWVGVVVVVGDLVCRPGEVVGVRREGREGREGEDYVLEGRGLVYEVLGVR